MKKTVKTKKSNAINSQLLARFKSDIVTARDSLIALASTGIAYVLENQNDEKGAFTVLTDCLKNQYTDEQWSRVKGAEYRKIRYIKALYTARYEALKNCYTFDGNADPIRDYITTNGLSMSQVLSSQSGKGADQKSKEKKELNKSAPSDLIARIVKDIETIKADSIQYKALQSALIDKFNLSLQCDNGLRNLYAPKNKKVA